MFKKHYRLVFQTNIYMLKKDRTGISDICTMEATCSFWKHENAKDTRNVIGTGRKKYASAMTQIEKSTNVE